jgi:hypothetical protein
MNDSNLNENFYILNLFSTHFFLQLDGTQCGTNSGVNFENYFYISSIFNV